MDYLKQRATWWYGNCYHLEQLNAIVSTVDIKAYAYILHDKDVENDVPKKPHWHLLIQFYTNQRGSWFKQFGSDDMGQVRLQPCFDPPNAFLYLTHETPTAIKQGKFIYDKSEVTSTIDNFDTEDKLDENVELWADIQDYVENKITFFEFIQKKPKRIHMISNIKNTSAMLFYEKYGRHLYDLPRLPQRELARHTPQIPKPSTIKMTPVTDQKELDNMPF